MMCHRPAMMQFPIMDKWSESIGTFSSSAASVAICLGHIILNDGPRGLRLTIGCRQLRGASAQKTKSLRFLVMRVWTNVDSAEDRLVARGRRG